MSVSNAVPFQVTANRKHDDRVFSNTDQFTREIHWFFRAREGTMGPYDSREAALEMMLAYKAQCQLYGLTGNR